MGGTVRECLNLMNISLEYIRVFRVFFYSFILNSLRETMDFLLSWKLWITNVFLGIVFD